MIVKNSPQPECVCCAVDQHGIIIIIIIIIFVLESKTIFGSFTIS